MEVFVIDTKKFVTLFCDDASGGEYVGKNEALDIIESAGATSDGQFSVNSSGYWQCTKDTLVWWQEELARRDALNERVRILCQQYSRVDVDYVICSGQEGCEFNDQVDAANHALDVAYGPDAEPRCIYEVLADDSRVKQIVMLEDHSWYERYPDDAQSGDKWNMQPWHRMPTPPDSITLDSGFQVSLRDGEFLIEGEAAR